MVFGYEITDPQGKAGIRGYIKGVQLVKVIDESCSSLKTGDYDLMKQTPQHNV